MIKVSKPTKKQIAAASERMAAFVKERENERKRTKKTNK